MSCYCGDLNCPKCEGMARILLEPKKSRRERITDERKEARREALDEVWAEMMAVVRLGRAPDWSTFVDRITHLREAR